MNCSELFPPPSSNKCDALIKALLQFSRALPTFCKFNFWFIWDYLKQIHKHTHKENERERKRNKWETCKLATKTRSLKIFLEESTSTCLCARFSIQDRFIYSFCCWQVVVTISHQSLNIIPFFMLGLSPNGNICGLVTASAPNTNWDINCHLLALYNYKIWKTFYK